MAAGNTYEAIAQTTVSGSSTTSITFSSIPQTYTDLVLIGRYTQASNNGIQMYFNGNPSTTSYSFNGVEYNGTRVARAAYTNRDTIYLEDWNGATAAGDFMITINLYQYASTSKFKTVNTNRITQTSGADNTRFIGTYGSTSAITEINLVSFTAVITAGGTFSLYGIKAA